MINTETEYQYNLRDLLTLIFRHKVKIVTVFLMVVAVGDAVTFKTAPTYEALSKILIKFGRENVFAPTLAAQQGRILFDASRAEGINSKVQITLEMHCLSLVSRMTELMLSTCWYHTQVAAETWFYCPERLIK